MELSTYFRINAENTGQFERTLIVADKGSYVSYLEGCTAPMRDENQLHAAVVEIFAHEDAEVKYSTVQNWYPGDAEGKGGIFNFVTKRALCAGDRSKVSWTQVETGSAITWKYPSCILKGEGSVGEFYSVALTNNRQQADTGTKMIHIGANTRSTIVSKGISAGRSNNTYRGLVRVLPRAENVRNFTQCDSLLLGNKCGAHTVPYIEVKNPTATIEHEATTSKISEDQLFYAMSRGLDSGSGGRADRQRLRARGAEAAADGVRGRGAEAAGDQFGRESSDDAVVASRCGVSRSRYARPGGGAVRSRQPIRFRERSRAAQQFLLAPIATGGDCRRASRLATAPTLARSADVKSRREDQKLELKSRARGSTACAQRPAHARRHSPGRDGPMRRYFLLNCPAGRNRQIDARDHQPPRDRRRQADPQRRVAHVPAGEVHAIMGPNGRASRRSPTCSPAAPATK